MERRWYRHHPDRLVGPDDIIIHDLGYSHPYRHLDVSEIGRKTNSCLLLVTSAVLLMATLRQETG